MARVAVNFCFSGLLSDTLFSRMNCCSILVIFLSYVSLVLAAAHPELVDPVLSNVDLATLVGILRVEDNPDALANFFEGLQVPISINICNLFHAIFDFGRTTSFAYLLAHLRMEPAKRDKDLTFLLHKALCHSNTEIARIILAQTFTISRQYVAVWLPHARDKPWNLDLLKQFISDHPGYAAGLVPNHSDFKFIRNAEEAFAMFELARHCAHVINPERAFDPTEYMENVLQFSLILNDDELAQVIIHLLQEGACVDPDFLNGPKLHRLNREQTMELLRSWIAEDIKVTEEEAAQLNKC